MKKTTKLLLILLLCSVLLSMLFSQKSFATEPEKYSITVNGDVANKEFYLLKLFDITMDGDNYYYSWDDRDTKAKKFFTQMGFDTAEKAQLYLSDYVFAHDNEELIQIANELYDPNDSVGYKKGGKNDTSITFTELDAGYYMVYDNTILAGIPRSCIMLKCITTKENVINLKSSKMTLTKEISKSSIENGESATITAHIKYPNMHGYRMEEHTLRLTEKLSPGITYNENSLSVVETEENTPLYFESTYDEATNTLIIDIKGLYHGSNSDEIIVQYDVTRNYNEGNLDNTSASTLEFSADPYNSETIDKIENVIVHTYSYKLGFIKKNVINSTLYYAKFKLRMPDGKWAILDDNGVLKGKVDDEENASVISLKKYGKFSIEGLKATDGYSLKEIETENGYTLPNFTYDFNIIGDVNEHGILSSSKYDFKTDETNQFAIRIFTRCYSTKYIRN